LAAPKRIKLAFFFFFFKLRVNSTLTISSPKNIVFVSLTQKKRSAV
jgi:hypothetical protein